MRRRPYHCLALLLLSVFLLTGCGGGGSTPQDTKGQAAFTIHWPDPTRLVPVASKSIKVSISNPEGLVVATNLMQRPPTGGDVTVTIAPLPAGTLPVSAVAYPEADGTGTPQAVANLSIVVNPGDTTTITLTLDSTITSIDVTATSLNVPAGGFQQLTHTERDQAGNVVLTLPNTITWQSSNTAVATVDSAGKVTGVSPGTADITVTETESGKSKTVTVTVGTSGGTGGTIAFIGKVAGDRVPSAYAMRGDGSGLVKVDPNPGGSGWEYGVAVSPNSQLVALAYHGGGSLYDNLYVVRADGTGLPPTWSAKAYPGWSWSPDSSRIVYSGAMAGGGPDGLHVINADGTGDVKISAVGRYPQWSPDGAWIVAQDFASNTLFLIRPDGTDRRDLTTGYDAKWLPNSHRLAFRREYAGGGGWALSLINDDGSGETQAVGYVDGDYRVSPDGTKIVYYTTSPIGTQTVRVGVYTVATGATQEIATGSSPAWSPNSTRIAYSSPSGVHLINPDGTGEYTLPGIDIAGALDWR
jgi:hypothetical protein